MEMNLDSMSKEELKDLLISKLTKQEKYLRLRIAELEVENKYLQNKIDSLTEDDFVRYMSDIWWNEDEKTT